MDIQYELSNKGYVIINNKKAKILGRVCMDQTMIDVSDIDDVKNWRYSLAVWRI